MNAAMAARVSDLRAQAARIRADDPQVRRFLDDAFTVIELLLASPPMAPAPAPAANEPASQQLRGMAELLDVQQQEVDELAATLDRVAALADFSEWAARSAGTGDPVVRTGDLRAALMGAAVSRHR